VGACVRRTGCRVDVTEEVVYHTDRNPSECEARPVRVTQCVSDNTIGALSWWGEPGGHGELPDAPSRNCRFTGLPSSHTSNRPPVPPAALRSVRYSSIRTRVVWGCGTVRCVPLRCKPEAEQWAFTGDIDVVVRERP
jgi:hypothetical protein